MGGGGHRGGAPGVGSALRRRTCANPLCGYSLQRLAQRYRAAEPWCAARGDGMLRPRSPQRQHPGEPFEHRKESPQHSGRPGHRRQHHPLRSQGDGHRSRCPCLRVPPRGAPGLCRPDAGPSFAFGRSSSFRVRTDRRHADGAGRRIDWRGHTAALLVAGAPCAAADCRTGGERGAAAVQDTRGHRRHCPPRLCPHGDGRRALRTAGPARSGAGCPAPAAPCGFADGGRGAGRVAGGAAPFEPAGFSGAGQRWRSLGAGANLHRRWVCRREKLRSLPRRCGEQRRRRPDQRECRNIAQPADEVHRSGCLPPHAHHYHRAPDGDPAFARGARGSRAQRWCTGVGGAPGYPRGSTGVCSEGVGPDRRGASAGGAHGGRAPGVCRGRLGRSGGAGNPTCRAGSARSTRSTDG